jgi:hypothetical protein
LILQEWRNTSHPAKGCFGLFSTYIDSVADIHAFNVNFTYWQHQ